MKNKPRTLSLKAVRDRIVINANLRDGRQFPPTSMAIAMVNAAVAYRGDGLPASGTGAARV